MENENTPVCDLHFRDITMLPTNLLYWMHNKNDVRCKVPGCYLFSQREVPTEALVQAKLQGLLHG